MTNDHNHESLSFGDALFLYLEREGMPLNVASVAQFEGPIGREDCIAFVASKLPLIPRYRQRVVTPAWNLGLPSWEYDPNFDIRNHVREVTLRHGSDAELKTFAGKLFGATMDRTRPLWDFTLVHGWKGDRTGLIVRIHHCLADGISGVGMLNVLMDQEPTPFVPAPPPKFRVPRPKDSASLLLDGMVSSSFLAIERMLTAQAELLEMAQQMAHSFAHHNGNSAEHALLPEPSLPSVEELRRFIPEFAAPSQRLPFNVVCRGPQRFDWLAIPLAEMKAVKRYYGATINDVYLTILAIAIRRYAELHHTRTSGRFLRAIVPVSIRGKDKAAELGNRITFLPVPIPLSRSSRKIIEAVRERMEFLKASRVAELVGFAGTLLGTIPPAVQAILAPIASGLPIPAGNVICTNVPGPHHPLYFMGHRMVSCYPYVPIGGEFAMNVALLTYDGVAHIGFSGDVNAVPDLRLLPKLVAEAFEELRKAARPKGGRERRRMAAIGSPLATAPPRSTATGASEAAKPLAMAATSG